MRPLSIALLLSACGTDSLNQLPETPEVPEQAIGQAPVAVIAPVAAEFPTPSTVRFDGRGSHDPDGTITGYQWMVISAPPGSANDPTPANAANAELVVGLAGTYVIGLRVQDNEGNISPQATVTFNATADEAIHVELTWDYDGNDVDLHLLRGSAQFGDPFNDCHYANCVDSGFGFSMVDWGVAGSDADDPSLDLDNIAQDVPENINLDRPEAGNFTVVVNYFGDHGSGPATATVRIFLNGALAGTYGPKVLDASCSKWRVAQIAMPAARVTPDGYAWTDDVDCVDGMGGF